MISRISTAKRIEFGNRQDCAGDGVYLSVPIGHRDESTKSFGDQLKCPDPKAIAVQVA
jgi:hypothetical protein